VEEAQALARLHCEAFPGFFLTSLGERFLGQLYRGFAASPDAICLVACVEGSIVGVVAGPVRPREFFRHLLRTRGAAFLLAAAPGLLRHPWRVGRRLLAAPFYRGEAPRRESAALVSTICVAPSGRGCGVAARMLERFCSEASTRGAQHVYLTTDRDENERVNAFYTQAGFELDEEIRRDGGRVMNRYIRDLESHGRQ
jgi:GNAT superfamily N-acetyltransferase